MFTRDHPTKYRHFLLVVWREPRGSPTDEPAWRIRLEDPGTGEKWGLGTFDLLGEKIETIMNKKEKSQK